MSKFLQSHSKKTVILGLIVFVFMAMWPEKESSFTSIPVSLSINKTDPSALDYSLEAAHIPLDDSPNWNPIAIRSGDSLSTIFRRAGLSAMELHDIMLLGRHVAVLGKIMPGRSLEFELDKDGSLKTLRYEETPLRTLVVARSETGFTSEWDLRKPEILTSFRSAKITKSNPSLYQAGKAVGLSDSLIMQLSYIFQWDISFALDLRQGDVFTLLYEDIYIEGEKVNEGEILAAQFRNLGKTYTAVLYEDDEGRKSFYTPEGRSMRKAFLRDPVHFSHVSSNFNLKRLHPIHKKVMPHRGIDYAANSGTPVLASGDGNVTIARKNSASGRYIVIQHGEQYSTRYLHLSAFANGVRAGKPVKQGQTIGYVGASGWATAAHLHYEFLVEGVHRNPRTVKLPKAEPIPGADLSNFTRFTQPILARLESAAGTGRYVSFSESE